MRIQALLVLLALPCLGPSCASSSARAAAPTPTDPNPENHAMTPSAAGLYRLHASSLEGEPVDLSSYAGRVTLVVNVASRCGYTPQYAGLQELHDELADRGFAVLGFPSNEFGAQEPGSPEQIREDYGRAHAEYLRIFGVPARSSAAPGWTVNARSLEVQEERALLFTSDTRGGSYFFPSEGGRVFRTLEIPTTLPTMDETLSWPELRTDEDQRRFQVEVAPFDDKPRVWVILAHRQTQEETAIQAYLDAMGRREEQKKWSDAGVMRYDLTTAPAQPVDGPVQPGRPPQ